MKIRQVGDEFFHADGTTDGRTDRQRDKQTDMPILYSHFAILRKLKSKLKITTKMCRKFTFSGVLIDNKVYFT
jgi:hypothetical protein